MTTARKSGVYSAVDAERVRAAARYLESARVRLSPGERVLLSREPENDNTVRVEVRRHG